MLLTSIAPQASSIESLAWLPLLSMHVKKLQPDKNCPQNLIYDLQVNKNSTQITSHIDRLNLDLDCLYNQQNKQVRMSEKEKNKQVKLFIKQLSTLPDFEFRLARINLLSKFISRTFSVSLWIKKTELGLTAILNSDLLSTQSFFNLKTKKLTVESTVQLSKLPRYLHLIYPQIEALNGELLLHYKSDLNYWNKGEFKIDWRGVLPALSEKSRLSIIGDLDLFKSQVRLSTFLLDVEQLNYSISEVRSWKSKIIKINNTKPVAFNYENLTIQSLPLQLHMSSSHLLTHVERGAGKRIRINDQKLPPLSMQLKIKAKEKTLLVDWVVTLLNQKLSGDIFVNAKIAKLKITKNNLVIKPLVTALAHYVDSLATVEIESGEIDLNLSAEYNIKDQLLTFESALVSNYISGKKEDILFDGARLNSHFRYIIDAQKSVTIEQDKQQLNIKNLFVGIPIQALQIDAKLQQLDPLVEHFKAHLLGGRLDFDNFKINAPSQTIIKLSGLSLSEIINYSAYPEIQGKGIIDGILPLTLTQDGPEIVDGTIYARSPGGYIKVPENTVVQAMGRANPAFSLTMQLLSNFQFDSMQGKVGYTADGESDLKVEIKGISPQISGTQPINFNYSHNENILKLLKSLRFNEQLVDDIKERY